jgi:hypothetical protein
VSVHHNPGRKAKPWIVRWRDHLGKNRSRSFATNEGAEAFDHKLRETPPPVVPPEIRGGRLVRVCPRCKEEIVERTDDDGIVSNNFLEHYVAEHPVAPDAEMRLIYLVPSEWKNARLTDSFNQMAREFVQKIKSDADGEPIRWVPVDRVDDLPNGVQFTYAGDVMQRFFRKKDEDDEGGLPIATMRGYHRMNEEQRKTYHRQHWRLWYATRYFIDQHEDQLPTFPTWDRDNESREEFKAKLDAYFEERDAVGKVIAKDLYAADEQAEEQFNEQGDFEGALATLEAAITASGALADEITAQYEKAEKERVESSARYKAEKEAERRLAEARKYLAKMEPKARSRKTARLSLGELEGRPPASPQLDEAMREQGVVETTVPGRKHPFWVWPKEQAS